MQYTIPNFGLPTLVPTEPSPIECDGCGALRRPYNLRETPDGNLCDVCFDASWFECDGCGDVTHNDDSFVSEGGTGPFCGSCYEIWYTRCDSCNSEIPISDAHRDRYRSTLCGECYWEVYTTCDGCGDEVHREDALYLDYGCYCGGRCAPCDDGDISAKSFRFLHDDTAVRIGSLRTFGVELETAECDGYMDLDGVTHFASKDDGSISGKEFVSCVLRGDRGLDAIADFCRHARCWGVDSRCGYHLHIGCQDLTDDELKSVCAAYYLTAQVWQSFVSSSRRNNSFCGRLLWNVEDLRDVSDFACWASGRDRYQWLNVSAYAERQTLEVRLHSGTLNASKVCNWVVAHIKFVDYVAKLSIGQVRAMFEGKTACEIFDLLAVIWNDSELTNFYADRARKHGTEYRAALAS